MHGSVFLRDLAWVLAASLPVLFLFRKLKAPAIAAFLVTGILIGPHALGLVEDPARVSGIAELGVALILFFVGLEFPLARLKTMGRSALVGGCAGSVGSSSATGISPRCACSRSRTRLRRNCGCASSTAIWAAYICASGAEPETPRTTRTLPLSPMRSSVASACAVL